MKIAVPRETAEGETRVALTPQAVGQIIADGNQVIVQAGAGEASFIADAAYREAGATIVPDAATLQKDAEMVLHVGRPSDAEIKQLKSGVVLIGTLGTLSPPRGREGPGRPGRDRHQHGRHPAHHPCPEHGLALEPEHGGRVQGRRARSGAPPQVHAAADHRRRHRPPGAGPGLRRRRRRPDGHRHRQADRRGRGGHRRAPGREGAGPEPGRHVPRGRDDRGGEGERRDRGWLRRRDDRGLQAPPGGADRLAELARPMRSSPRPSSPGVRLRA